MNETYVTVTGTAHRRPELPHDPARGADDDLPAAPPSARRTGAGTAAASGPTPSRASTTSSPSGRWRQRRGSLQQGRARRRLRPAAGQPWQREDGIHGWTRRDRRLHRRPRPRSAGRHALTRVSLRPADAQDRTADVVDDAMAALEARTVTRRTAVAGRLPPGVEGTPRRTTTRWRSSRPVSAAAARRRTAERGRGFGLWGHRPIALRPCPSSSTSCRRPARPTATRSSSTTSPCPSTPAPRSAWSARTVPASRRS